MAQSEIYKIMAEDPGEFMTIQDLKEKTGLSLQAINSNLKKLEDFDLIQRIDLGPFEKHLFYLKK